MDRTKTWLRRFGRPLELARWEFLFESGTKERVIKYLTAFQNDDGGFGHGLEPDFWAPNSSPMASWVAGQIFIEAQADSEDDAVQKLTKYLRNTPQVKPGMWPSVLQENNLHPHAPWWHWEEDVQAGWMFNPSVELAAFLILWLPCESEGAELGWKTLRHAVQHVLQVGRMKKHEIQNYLKSLKLLRPYADDFSSRTGFSYALVEGKVQDLVMLAVEQDRSKWHEGYKPLPLDFVESPDSPLYKKFESLVEANLDFFQEQLSKQGVWEIPWQWGQYDEEFAIARRHWQGILAVNRFKILRAFGRV